MSKRHNILPTKTSFFISSAGKIGSVQEFKMKLFGLAFSLQIVWLHVVVSNQHDILHFRDNGHFSKY